MNLFGHSHFMKRMSFPFQTTYFKSCQLLLTQPYTSQIRLPSLQENINIHMVALHPGLKRLSGEIRLHFAIISNRIHLEVNQAEDQFVCKPIFQLIH